MSIAVADILRRVSVLLQDEEFVRWRKAELIDWLNDAAAETVLRRPSAYTITGEVTATATPIQQLPSAAIELLDVFRRQDGQPVTLVGRHVLDAQDPTWRQRKPTARVLHYCYDVRLPKQFTLYPVAAVGTLLEVSYSATPPVVTSEAGTLPLDQAYLSPIVSFILYRALSKDATDANPTMAAGHFQAFTESLTGQNDVSIAAQPQQASP